MNFGADLNALAIDLARECDALHFLILDPATRWSEESERRQTLFDFRKRAESIREGTLIV